MSDIEIRVTPAVQIGVLVLAVVGLLGLIGVQLPEIQRYLKIRSM
jgi:uncharacterized protein DUF6893